MSVPHSVVRTCNRGGHGHRRADMTDNALTEAARVSKAWPFEEARKLLKRYPVWNAGG